MFANFGYLRQERQRDIADRPVAVLGDDDVGLAQPLGLPVVVLVAVDEHHEVGVLLDRPASRRSESIGLGGFRDSTARESCETAITGTSSSRARIFRPRLIWPICSTRLLRAALGAHQLQVVHDHQAEAVAGRQAARLRAQLQHAHVARVVHEDRRAASFSTACSTFGHFSARTRPFRRSSLDTRAWEARKRCASSVSDISSENSATGTPASTAAYSAMFVAAALFPIDGRAASTIRLPGWKPPVSASRSVKPEGVPVSADVRLRQLLELVDLVVEDRLQRAHLRRAAVVADLEQHRLGALDQLAGLAAVGGHVVLDLAGGLQHAPEQRVLLDDARVVEHRAHRGHDRRQRMEVGLAARLLELAAAAQLLGHRERVDRLGRGLLLQADHRLEDRLVARAVEVVRAQPDLEQDAVQRLLGEQDRAEDGGLGLVVVRRNAGRHLGRDGDGHARRWG